MITAILAGVPRYRERPEIFSLLFISLLGFILYGYKTKRLKREYVFIIPVVMVLWDFLHGALYGVIFLSAFVIGETGKNMFSNTGESCPGAISVRSETGYIKTLLIVYLVSLTAMVINPYGLRTYDIFVEFLRANRMVLGTNEFTPPDLVNFPLFWLFFALICKHIGRRGGKQAFSN